MNAVDDRPALLVIATGPRLYREYLLRWISTRYRIHLFLSDPSSREQEYISGAAVLESTNDVDALCVAPGSGNRRKLTAARRDKGAMARAFAHAGAPQFPTPHGQETDDARAAIYPNQRGRRQRGRRVRSHP